MSRPGPSGAEIVALAFRFDNDVDKKLAALVDAVAHDYAVHSAMFNGCGCGMCNAYLALIEEATR